MFLGLLQESKVAPTFGFVEYNDPLVHTRNPYADMVTRVCAAYSGRVKPQACLRAAELDAAAAAMPTPRPVAGAH